MRSPEEIGASVESLVALGDFSASGIVIKHSSRNTWILTAAHVVESLKKIQVSYRNTDKFIDVSGIVQKVDREHDLALVRTKRLLNPPMLVATDFPDVYSNVLLVGNSSGFFGTVVEGLLTAKDGSNHEPSGMDQISGWSAPGASGGGVVNFNGELVGIISSISHTGNSLLHGITFSVSLRYIHTFLTEAFKEKD